jgi:hypothetical protein
VSVQGSRIRVELNGTPILDADINTIDPATVLDGKAHPGLKRASGYFGFAGHNDPVSFRELSVKRLP